MQLVTDIHAKEDVAQRAAEFPSCDVDLSTLVNRLERLTQPQAQPLPELAFRGLGGSEKAVSVWSGRATIPCFTFQAGRPSLRCLVSAQQAVYEPIEKVIRPLTRRSFTADQGAMV